MGRNILHYYVVSGKFAAATYIIWFNLAWFLFVVYAYWKPSVNVYTHENLDRALVQWLNMALCEYKMQIC